MSAGSARRAVSGRGIGSRHADAVGPFRSMSASGPTTRGLVVFDSRRRALVKYISELERLVISLEDSMTAAEVARERAYDALAELEKQQRQGRPGDGGGEPEPQEPDRDAF